MRRETEINDTIRDLRDKLFIERVDTGYKQERGFIRQPDVPNPLHASLRKRKKIMSRGGKKGSSHEFKIKVEEVKGGRSGH